MKELIIKMTDPQTAAIVDKINELIRAWNEKEEQADCKGFNAPRWQNFCLDCGEREKYHQSTQGKEGYASEEGKQAVENFNKFCREAQGKEEPGEMCTCCGLYAECLCPTRTYPVEEEPKEKECGCMKSIYTHRKLHL